MIARKAEARWEGDLRNGRGQLSTQSGALKAPYSAATRFEESQGTNPEELIAAAHASCFSMALASELAKSEHPPKWIATSAEVFLAKTEKGYVIARIRLEARAEAPGIDEAHFQIAAEAAKDNCPVSRALAGPEIELDAKMEGQTAVQGC